jgi:divalent metal cation (Fe/Co/Zn/Cd) transporter
MIGLLLIVVAGILAQKTASLLVGEGADAADLARIRTALVGGGVDGIIHIRTLYVGPDELMIAAKIAVAPTESAAEVAAAINEAEARVRAAVPEARLIFLEPDIARGNGGPAGVPTSS